MASAANKFNTTPISVIGTWWAATTGSPFYSTSTVGAFGAILGNNNDTVVYMSSESNATNGLVASAATNIGIDNAYVNYHFTVAIEGWASSLTMANRSVEEYAYSTGTSTAAASADNSSFGYGSTGAQFVSINSNTLASSSTKRVRFQTPILPTDTVGIEVLYNGVWAPIANAYHTQPFALQNTAYFGMRLGAVSSTNATDMDVFFGNSGRFSNSSSFGTATGAAWSDIGGQEAHKWRVRKVSGGASVGFPVASSNIIHQETLNVITTTATIAAVPTNVINLCNSGSAFTITIGAIASAPNGTILRFKNIGAGVVTLDANASETIDGLSTWQLSQYSAVDIIAYNGAWYVR